MTTQEKIHLGVLFGGRSGEHEVSLLSARSILSVLDPEKYAVTQIGITHDGKWLAGQNALEALETGDLSALTPVTLLPEPGHPWLYARRPVKNGVAFEPFTRLDAVFPVLHGTGGEDGQIQGLFELAEIAYVGAGVLGSAVGMDKSLFKDVMRANRLPVVNSITVTRTQIDKSLATVTEMAEALADYPLFTKPANLGSSVGVSKCHNRAELLTGLKEAARYDRRVLIEQGIEAAIEIEVSVLGNEKPIASQPGEIRPSSEFYSYTAKYVDNKSTLLVPAPLPVEVNKQIRRLALQAYQLTDCAGMARVDFLIEPEEYTIYISEINTIPGFTRISMYPKLWEISGMSYPELVDRLIALAFERKALNDLLERQYGRKL